MSSQDFHDCRSVTLNYDLENLAAMATHTMITYFTEITPISTEIPHHVEYMLMDNRWMAG